jgi:hypothetical protein
MYILIQYRHLAVPHSHSLRLQEYTCYPSLDTIIPPQKQCRQWFVQPVPHQTFVPANQKLQAIHLIHSDHLHLALKISSQSKVSHNFVRIWLKWIIYFLQILDRRLLCPTLLQPPSTLFGRRYFVHRAIVVFRDEWGEMYRTHVLCLCRMK